MTIFSPQQDAALVAVSRWLADAKSGRAPQVFRLFGFAGTGKTTLARHIADNVDGEVKFAAFTGKAAMMLRAKGCNDASTIHSHDLPVADRAGYGRAELLAEPLLGGEERGSRGHRRMLDGGRGSRP